MKNGHKSVHIAPEQLTALKHKAVDNQTTIKQLVHDAIVASLQRNTKQTIGTKI